MSARAKFRKLMRMSLAELSRRTRQETAKWLDRELGVTYRCIRGNLMQTLHPNSHLAELRASLRRGDMGEASRVWQSHLLEMLPARFFEGVASGAARVPLTDLFSDLYGATVGAAENIYEGRFDLLGYRELTLGMPPDWHRDPVAGRRAPLVHWSRLDPLDRTRVGDSKIVWELNRHQWMVRLGQAYWFTGDERYADCFVNSLENWFQANPPGMGINWASSLEVALRLIAWSWALVLFRRSQALSPGFFLHLMETIRAHACHVERYLSYYFAPNTHLTGEALGLFYAGILFPEFQAAPRWRALGADILIEQSRRQILPDGVYFEQATCYQRYTAEIYLHFLILAKRNRFPVPPEVTQKVQGLLDALLTLCGPKGTMPHIGDADGGWLLPLAPRTPEDCRGVFATGAALFARADYAWAAGGPAPETLWLLGASSLHTIEEFRPGSPKRPLSCLLPAGGYAVMRSQWDPGGHQLIFDVGPLGSPITSGHAHADLLSIQCSVFGEPCLVDTGTYCYTANAVWRDYFRSTAAHNTVTVDGAGQATPDGPFAWQHRPRARLRRWVSTDLYDLADADHDSYRNLPDPVGHRRRVIFVKPRYWIVIDDLDGAAEHRLDLWFHFAPSGKLDLGDALSVSAWWQKTRGLLVQPFSKAPLKRMLYHGAQDPIAGWVSPDYGRREPAPTVRVSTVARLPVRILTLLMPLESSAARQPQVIPLFDEADEIIGLSLDGDRERIRFDRDSVTLA